MGGNAQCPHGAFLGACRNVAAIVVQIFVGVYNLYIVTILFVGLLELDESSLGRLARNLAIPGDTYEACCVV